MIAIEKLLYSALFGILAAGVSAQHPSIGGYNVYYGHLHNHSTVSDASGTPDHAYNYAKNTAGLDFFSLADHAESMVEAEWLSIKAAADKYNKDSVFTAFWGFEKSSNGHVAVINTPDYTGISADPSGTFAELCAWLNARNGVAFFNHPGRTPAMLFQGFATPPSDKFVGMELWNGTANFSMHFYNDGFYRDDGNLNHFAEANSRGWRIGASGSDDNHGGSWGTRTGYRLAILADHLTRADLFAALQARRFYSTLDKNLALSFKMGGNEMGSNLTGGPTEIQIQASDKDGEYFTKVMLYRNGIETKTWVVNTPLINITLPVSTYDGDFFYVKVTQQDGNEAISSPVFFKGGVFNVHPSITVTAPENGIHLENPQSITITAEAADTDGSVVSVEFFVNGIPVGSDTLAPYTVHYTIPNNGAYSVTAKVTDNGGTRITSSPVAFTVGSFSETRSSRISSDMDDVEEFANGYIDVGSSDLELGYENTTRQTICLRFTGLNIPRGATIQSASIQFTVDEVSVGACTLNIKGHDADNSEPIGSAAYNVSGRLTTTAEVTWVPAPWPAVGAAGADQKTPDLSAIIREIVNRPGYTRNSAISIIITGTGERTAEAYEGSAGSAALLTVNYSVGTISSSPVVLNGSDVRIYPNPVSDGLLTVDMNSGFEDGTAVTIFDIFGRICYLSQIEKSKTVINVSGFKPGLYIIKVSDNNIVYSRKLFVE